MDPDQPPRDEPASPIEAEPRPVPALRCAIALEYSDRVNFAMQQNGVPLVQAVNLTLDADADADADASIEDVVVTLRLDNDEAEPWTGRLARLDPGIAVALSPETFGLSAQAIATRTEAVRTAIVCDVSSSQGVATDTFPIDLLAYDQWPGVGYAADLTAAFVTPNHAKVAELLQLARGTMSQQSDSDALDGYQSKSRQRAALLAEACFHAAAAQGLGYINPPASFEDTGQRVRLIDRVLRERLGTCLDLSLMLASMWEQCGLHPLILLPNGHAMPAVWTHPTHLAETIIDEPARIRNLIELGEIVPVEATHLTHAGPRFAEAVEAAKQTMQRPGASFHAIDIRSARKRGVRPLPIRDDGEAGVDLDAVQADAESFRTSPLDRVALADRADAWAQTQNGQDIPTDPDERIARWQKRLLDLSLRNRLLNYKETGRTLPLSVPDLARLENKLAQGDRLEVCPKIEDRDEKDAYLLEELADNRLHTDETESQSQKRLLNLYRTAKSSIEETGANVLYLALGLLKWFEHDAADQPRYAPLILLPVTLVRSSSGAGYAYTIELSEEPLYPNVTLLEKLRAEFGIETAALDDLPEDESGLDLALIFRNVRAAIRNMSRWEVVDAASLGLFSFNKFLMWKDLQEKTVRLKENRLVKHLVDLPDEPFDTRPFPRSEDLDDAIAPGGLLCTRDADSSQLTAVCAAAEERTFVLEGPPGTGKSQTIANVIADALARGRRVLFVAEKMAALSVVRKRLEDDGLGAFCLELHSAKASKKQVIAQIEESLHAPRGSELNNWDALCQELGTTRDTLNAYVRAIHEPRAIGMSLYQMLGRLNLIGDGATAPLPTRHPADADQSQLNAWTDAIELLQARAQPVDPVCDAPLRGIGQTEWSFSLPKQAEASLRDAAETAEALRQSVADFLKAADIAVEANAPGQEAIEALVAYGKHLATCPTPDRAWLEGSKASDLRDKAKRVIEIGRERDALRDTLAATYRREFLEIDTLVHLDAIKRHLDRPAILRWFTASGVKKPLRKYAQTQLPPLDQVREDLERVREVKRHDDELNGFSQVAAAFATSWNNGDADWSQLDTTIRWCDEAAASLATLQQDPALAEATAALIDLASVDGRAESIRAAADTLHQTMDAWSEAWTIVRRVLMTDSAMAFGDCKSGWLASVAETLSRWAANLGGLNTWCNYRAARDRAEASGLRSLLERYEIGDASLADLDTIFWRSFGHAWFNAVADSVEPVRRFNADAHTNTAERFRLLDRQAIQVARHIITGRLDRERPRPTNAASQSEMGILRREIEKKRRHLPTRRLIESIPTLLPKLKPCFLMSPLSVAQFLAAELPPFDLVVFDEASQIPVWDAIGAIARGKEVIVVGDSKQLPPTTFFSTLDDGEDDYDANDHAVDDMESILKECSASAIPSLRLRWHYRSRHESLITFSNHHYYQNELHTFPSPVERSEQLGVSFRHVEDGVYDRGGSRTNRKEAEAVVEQVVAMLLDPASTDSIGVVTFSQAQQNLVEDLIDEQRRLHPELDARLDASASEPVFVKNLENVQGDERDTIIFSVGYGPDETGKQSMNFGPLNKDGGERRLNVAVTRARRRLIVFSSITSDDIDLRRTRATGVQHFKTFLDYAKRGPLAIPDADALTDDKAFDEGFERVVVEALANRGWSIDTRVGCAGYRIDLAVQHPDDPSRYLVGIECDGKSYHSAKTARDRDRIREAVLEGLGWRIARVWSTQWQVDPDGCLAQLEAAITDALDSEQAQALADATPDTEPQADPQDPTDDEESPLVANLSPNEPADDDTAVPTDWLFADAPPEPASDEAEPGVDAPPVYRPARLTKRDTAVKDIYADSATNRLTKALTKIVEIEAPIVDELASDRLAEAFGITRSTQRYKDRFAEILRHAIDEGTLRSDGTTLWRPDQAPDAYTLLRIADDDAASQREIDHLPQVELRNACALVLAEQFGLPREDLVREAAKRFGFNRTTQRIADRFNQAIDRLIASGQAKEADGRVTPTA